MFLHCLSHSDNIKRKRRSRSRSRTRSRSPKRSRGGQGHTGNHPKPKRQNRFQGKKTAAKKEEKAKKSGTDFWSPLSFDDAWHNGFFLPKVILTLTAVGLSIARIPFVHALALGGRLKHCVNEWIQI